MPLCSFFFPCPFLSIPLSLITNGDHCSLLFLSLSLSFVRSLLSHSNIEKTKELYVYRRGGRRHHYCIVEEKRRRRKGGRHVVLYAFSHHSFSLECRFVLLSFTRQKKFDILYENYMMVHHR